MSMERVSNVLGQIKSKADINQFRFADVYTIVEAQKQLLESLLNSDIPLQEKDAITRLISDIFPQLIKNMMGIHKKAKAKVWKLVQESLENSMYDTLLNEKKSLRTMVNNLLSYDFGTGDPEAEKFLIAQLRDSISFLFSHYLSKWTEDICTHVSFDYQRSKDVEKELTYLKEQGCLDTQSYTYAQELVSNAYIQEHFKEVYINKDTIVQTIRHAQKTNDISAPIEMWIDEMNDVIYKKNEELAGEEKEILFFKKLCDDVQEAYSKEIYILCESFVNTVISEDIDELHNKDAVDAYEHQDVLKQWKSLLKFLSTPQKEHLLGIFEDLKKEQLLTLKINLPKVKVRGDEVHFGSVVFPKFLYTPKTLWKPEPELVGNNVLLHIKDHKSGKIIKASDEKKIRPEYPYKMSEAEYKNMMTKYTMYHKTKECTNFFAEEERLLDDLAHLENKKSLEGENLETRLHEVREEIEKNIPYYFRVIKQLNAHPRLFSALKKPPELQSKIVITPYVMGNLHKIVRLAEYQLLNQDGIGILEGEAGVGKNVSLDIFAHYTGRPVFTFSCNKKTTKDDLTYLWLLDKNGTYQLNSEFLTALDTEGAILIVDEITSLPEEVAKMTNPLFDGRRTLYLPHSGISKKAKDSVLMFGTMNPNTHVYKGNNVLSAETYSRAFFQFFDYPPLMTKEGIVNYDDALMTYKNVPYYYKLLSKDGFTKGEIDEIKYYIIREYNGNGLREDQKEKIYAMQNACLSDKEFIQAWNDIINNSNKKSSYIPEFVAGIESLYELLLYANYFRSKYIKNMTGIDKTQNKISSSVSQRDLNKMAYLLCLGYTPKQAFLEVYVNSIPSLSNRETIKNQLMTLSHDDLNQEVLEYSTNASLKLKSLFTAM